METGNYHDTLRNKMDVYAHLVYSITKTFPKDELYGVTSQLRRSPLSVILNYIEGFARQRSKVYKNFLEISYGSLHESKYLLGFCKKENYLENVEYERATKLADDIGAMLWGIMSKI